MQELLALHVGFVSLHVCRGGKDMVGVVSSLLNKATPTPKTWFCEELGFHFCMLDIFDNHFYSIEDNLT